VERVLVTCWVMRRRKRPKLVYAFFAVFAVRGVRLASRDAFEVFEERGVAAEGSRHRRCQALVHRRCLSIEGARHLSRWWRPSGSPSKVLPSKVLPSKVPIEGARHLSHHRRCQALVQVVGTCPGGDARPEAHRRCQALVQVAIEGAGTCPGGRAEGARHLSRALVQDSAKHASTAAKFASTIAASPAISWSSSIASSSRVWSRARRARCLISLDRSPWDAACFANAFLHDEPRSLTIRRR
jgi:hypothetical protein